MILKLGKNPHDALRLTSEGIRVLRTGRKLPYTEVPYYGVQLVSDRNYAAGDFPWQFAIRRSGVVVTSYGLRDPIIVTRIGGVISTHNALQGRKLDDHLSYKINFAQLGGANSIITHAPGEGEFLSYTFMDKCGQLLHPLSFIIEAPQLLLKDNVFQIINFIGKPFLLVFAVEEFSIGKPRSEDSLVSMSDDCFVAHTIGNSDEFWQQGCVRRRTVNTERKVPLMFLHGRFQNFHRQR